MKGGRPAVYLGARAEDRRIRYVNVKGRTRGFYARWRKNLKSWECHLRGYGIQSRQWFSPSQTLALAKLRQIRCLWNWRPIIVDASVNWDGIPDSGYSTDPDFHLDLFAGAPTPIRSAEPSTLPAASKDRVNSSEGSGALAPELLHGIQVVDSAGLEVGFIPADHPEFFSSLPAFLKPGGV